MALGTSYSESDIVDQIYYGESVEGNTTQLALAQTSNVTREQCRNVGSQGSKHYVLFDAMRLIMDRLESIVRSFETRKYIQEARISRSSSRIGAHVVMVLS